MTTWMNEDEIAEAVERFDDPGLDNLRRGAHTLRRLMRWTNENSDGWPYWKKPAAAANKLMELLDTKTREQSHRGDGLTDITDAELAKALSPIKAFLTREGVDHSLILEEARGRLTLNDLPGGVNNPHPGIPAEPHTERKLEVTETSADQITIQFDGLEIQLWRSSLEEDKGQPVVQIDGAGMLRVNVNDYPIWNADPDHHEHQQCECVIEFESREAP